MDYPEIIIKKTEQIQTLASLPDEGSSEYKLAINPKGSAKASLNITKVEPGSKAEAHDNYNDTFLILEGEEEIHIGGEIINRTEKEPGEWRGPDLINFRTYHIGPGDLVIIPKGIPHRHGEGRIKMVVIKTN